MHTGHMATVGLSIESANVVGYQTKAVGKNLSQQVCTFDQIGVTGGALDIQKLLPVDGEGNEVSGEVTVQFISPLGVLLTSYTYYEAGGYDDGYAAGWYDDDGELTTYSFDSSEAFLVYSGTACNFQYSGEVNMAETDVPFGKNLSVQANIRPTTVDIQTVIPVDDEDAEISGDVTIQFLTSLGALQTSYTYYETGGYDEGYAAGWYDDNGELAQYSFAPGEGFMVYAGTTGYLRFPEL